VKVQSADAERLEGRVREFDAGKGWGFIVARDRAGWVRDYFVQRGDLVGPDLLPGERVSFRPTQSANGLRAIRVRRVDGT
jgi:cold shock CspA family protein